MCLIERYYFDWSCKVANDHPHIFIFGLDFTWVCGEKGEIIIASNAK